MLINSVSKNKPQLQFISLYLIEKEMLYFQQKRLPTTLNLCEQVCAWLYAAPIIFILRQKSKYSSIRKVDIR